MHLRIPEPEAAAGGPDRVGLRERHGLFPHHAPQVEDDRFLDAGDIDGQRLVEGEGAVLVVEGGGDGPALALTDRGLGPAHIRAAAGGDDLQEETTS